MLLCEQTVLQCSRTMLLAMTYDLCHGGHMVAEYPLLHTPLHVHLSLTVRQCAAHHQITSQRLLDQSQAGVYMGKTPHTPPFGPIRVPYPKGLNC